MSGTAADGRPAAALLGRWGTLAVYAGLTVVVLLPVFAVQVPCLGDYLNHLARIHILTTAGSSPELQRFYLDRWQVVPYFGMDLPVAALARVMPLYDAGRLFVGLCVLMPVLAAATLHYAVYRRVGLVPALAFLLSYNYALEWGFLAYLFSAGLAVMLFAGWLAAAGWRRWRRAALFAAGALLLYFSHAFAFIVYGILVGGYELGRVIRRGGRPVGAVVADVAAAAAQALPVLAVASSGLMVSGFSGSGVTQFGPLWWRPGLLLSPLYFDGSIGVQAAMLVVPLLGLPLLARARLAPAVWPALAAVVAVAGCVPHVLLNVWGAAFRLPLVAAIVLIGSLSRGPRLGRAGAAAVLAVAALLVLLRAADAFTTLRQLDAQVAQVRQVVAALPAGARLLVVDDGKPAPLRIAPKGATWHLGLLATIDRDALVPLLFTGVTAVQIRPEVASQGAEPVTMAQLREGYAQRSPPEGPPPFGDFGGTKYWLGWADKYDDVLVVHFGADPGAMPPVLRRIASAGVADLYQVTRP